MKEYPAKLTSGFYRVMKDWEDKESQIGAFRLLSKAKAKADENPGYFVFTDDGTAIYPTVSATDAASHQDGEVDTEKAGADVESIEPETESAEPGEVIAYARLKTLMNIRTGASVESEAIAIYKRGTILEVLEQCENGWLKFICPESATGTAYVSNEGGAFAFLGQSIYTVQPGDNLFKIAEKTMGSGTKAAQIRDANLLTSNQIRVGMKLIIP